MIKPYFNTPQKPQLARACYADAWFLHGPLALEVIHNVWRCAYFFISQFFFTNDHQCTLMTLMNTCDHV